MLDALTAEFVEERVRQNPKKSFDLVEASRALSEMLAEAGEKAAFSARDLETITALLDRHPFVLRQPGAKPSWKPGLDRAQIKARS
ncbi:MAG: hypothetical protein K2X62_02040 [Beijerinckiaceae bacterium]|nr:hypothetical protein [Beijerinckiaceae bacterium]